MIADAPHIDVLVKEEKHETKTEELAKAKKGSKCSASGSAYEKIVHRIAQSCRLDGRKFNTQDINELGGSSKRNDLACNFKSDRDVHIEIKRGKAPDFVQCKLCFDKTSNRWTPKKTPRGHPDCILEIFERCLGGASLFGGKIPPFEENPIKYDDWVEIKQSDYDTWKDIFIKIPSDTIRSLYSLKNNQYIQIEKSGLFHLGDDVCNFGVPLFEPEQHLRIRIKPHKTKNSKGYASLSVTATCTLLGADAWKTLRSPFSLDSLNTLPPLLTHKQ